MSTALRLIHRAPMPTATDQTPSSETSAGGGASARQRREIQRYDVTSTYCHPADVACYLRMLDMARKLRELADEPYPFEAACVSRMLDVDQQTERSIRDYARMWGWSRWQVEKLLPEIEERVTNWRTAYGRLENGENYSPASSQSPATRQTKKAQNNASNGDYSPASSQSPASDSPHSNQLSTLNSQENASCVEPPERGSQQQGEAQLAAEVKPEPRPEPAAAFQLVDGSAFELSAEQVAGYAAAYPAVDVPQQLRSLAAWCLSNPTRRKTRRGALRFVNSWLAKAQDSAREGPVRDRGGVFPVQPDQSTAWWMMSYAEARARAAKDGVADWMRVWSRFRGPDGKPHFIAPENLRRGIPEGYQPWDA